MQRIIPKVGQVLVGGSGFKYIIIRITSSYAYDLREDGREGVFCSIESDGTMHLADYWMVESYNSKKILKKIIPDIPLDTSLHILEAGHIQDRARKKFKP